MPQGRDDHTYRQDMPDQHLWTAPSKVMPDSGMYVAGYSQSPTAYDSNSVAIFAIIAGTISMLVLVIPNIGRFIAMPTSIAAILCGIAGIVRSKRANGRRGDVAVSGLVMGVASVILTSIIFLMASGMLGVDNATSYEGEQTAIAGTSSDPSDEGLRQLMTTATTDEARLEIVGSTWGSGITRASSYEVIDFGAGGHFEAWTTSDDGSISNSRWAGTYTLVFGEKALDAVTPKAKTKMEEELDKSKTFALDRVVYLEMKVAELDDAEQMGVKSETPPMLRMVGHYVPDGELSQMLYMRDVDDLDSKPTVLYKLNAEEAGL